MISVIITSFNESDTIAGAIDSFKNEKFEDKIEIIVTAPDEKTLNVAKKMGAKVVQDGGFGKPAALNMAIEKAKGEILILTDGDIETKGSNFLAEHFKDKGIGGVSGRVISENSREKMFGYWAYILTESFHNLRKIKQKKSKDIVCSGYLYAIRKKLFKRIPIDILADDAFISMAINKSGHRTIYEEKAIAIVKYPTNLPDWIRQKKRTAGRFYQLKQYFSDISKTSSFKEEVIPALNSFRKINSPKEFIWIKWLIAMRFYIWARVFLDFRLWRRDFNKTWERVESTK